MSAPRLPGRVAACTALALLATTPLAAQWSAPAGTTVRDAFGPTIGGGASRCRGACGPDCPDTCERTQRWECLDAMTYLLLEVFDCGTHTGCREHDDCLDECARRFPGAGRTAPGPGDWRPVDRNFFFGECSYRCHQDALNNYGPGHTWPWTFGDGPYDGRTTFEYSRDSPDAPERIFRCPDGTRLDCSGERIACRPVDPGDEDGAPAPAVPVPALAIAVDRACVPAGETATVTGAVHGVADRRLRWTVAGPAQLDPNGTLRPSGNGRVSIVAESVGQPGLRDEVEIAVGRCGCTFTASLAGDTHRGTVSGAGANFSTRGQATILGGSATPEALEDLLALTRRTGGLSGLGEETEGRLTEMLEQQIAKRREQAGASAGSSLGLSLVETGDRRIGPAAGGGLATAFKLDVLANASIEPGFAGPLPVHNLVLHSGEFAAEGGAPMLYRWSEGDPGSVQLHVERYDGSWLEGSVVAELEGVTGLMMTGGGKPRVQVRADFRAGAFNPLRFENVCAFAQVEAMEE